MKKFFPVIFAVILLFFDQLSKMIVRNTMSEGESIPVVGQIFHLTYIENRGIAFGLFSGHSVFFVVLSLIVLIGLCGIVVKESSDSLFLSYGAALVVSGALGNMIDRVYKASVTDMFDFRIWPIFNLADIAVCVGFFLLVIYILFESGDDNDNKNHSTAK